MLKVQSICAVPLKNLKNAIRGREPWDTMSLRYADTSLPDLLGRPSLRYAEMSMRIAQYIKMCLYNTGGFF